MADMRLDGSYTNICWGGEVISSDITEESSKCTSLIPRHKIML